MHFLDPTHLINTYGAAGVLLIVFIESGLLPVPLPGDSLLFLAGLFASTSATADHPHLNLLVMVIGSFALAVLGGEIGYWIGSRFGTRLFKPGARFFKPEYETRAHEFFERQGPKAIVIARFVPVVRTIMPILAGTSEMKARVFLIYNTIGAAIWAVGFTLLGYTVGDHIGAKNVEKYDYLIVFVIVVLSLIPPAIEWRKHRREQAQKAEATAEA
jgi:membrane-associated protein